MIDDCIKKLGRVGKRMWGSFLLKDYLECEERNDGMRWIGFGKSGVFRGGSGLKCGEGGVGVGRG